MQVLAADAGLLDLRRPGDDQRVGHAASTDFGLI
jgi:hypothetical protein